MNHLFTGTRTNHLGMLRLARQLARGAMDRNETIFVGDAWGVDAVIIDECNKHIYKNIQVYGWDKKVRHKTKYGENIALPTKSPIARNAIMVKFALKDNAPARATAIWDGKSRGTRDTITRLKEAGLGPTVYDFSKRE